MVIGRTEWPGQRRPADDRRRRCGQSVDVDDPDLLLPDEAELAADVEPVPSGVGHASWA